jgi:hypothetical protein
MGIRGNEPPHQHTAWSVALPLLVVAGAVAAAAVAADVVAYGAWRGAVFLVLLAVALPLLKRLPAPAPRRVRDPARAAVAPGPRAAAGVALVFVPAFAPFLAFGMSEGCGGCPEAMVARNAIVGGSLLIAVVYLVSQRRGGSPETARRVAGGVPVALGLLVFGAMAYVSVIGPQ